MGIRRRSACGLEVRCCRCTSNLQEQVLRPLLADSTLPRMAASTATAGCDGSGLPFEYPAVGTNTRASVYARCKRRTLRLRQFLGRNCRFAAALPVNIRRSDPAVRDTARFVGSILSRRSNTSLKLKPGATSWRTAGIVDLDITITSVATFHGQCVRCLRRPDSGSGSGVSNKNPLVSWRRSTAFCPSISNDG